MKKLVGRISAFVVAVSLSLTLSVVAFADDSAKTAPASGTVSIDFGGKTTPRVIGPYLMAHAEDARFTNNGNRLSMRKSVQDSDSDVVPSSENEVYNTIPTIKGDIKLSTNFTYYPAIFGFFEYVGDVFYDTTDENTVTMTMPEGVKAVSFRVVTPSDDKTYVNVTTNDGKVINQEIDNSIEDIGYDQKGFAFYNETAGIKSVTIKTSSDSEYSRGVAIGDVYVDSRDLRTLLPKMNVENTGKDYSNDILSADYNAFIKTLLKEYGILKDIKLSKDGKVVTEAKEDGSYDLVISIANIDSYALYNKEINNNIIGPSVSIANVSVPVKPPINTFKTKTEFDNEERAKINLLTDEELAQLMKKYTSEEFLNETNLTVDSTITIKGYLTINNKSVVIPEEVTPLAPVANPKTGVQTAAIALMLVGAASVSAIVVAKKKNK